MTFTLPLIPTVATALYLMGLLLIYIRTPESEGGGGGLLPIPDFGPILIWAFFSAIWTFAYMLFWIIYLAVT